jgi:CheY-like chemotaxis protein
LLVASRRPIDLLVADVRLPGISGLELMARIKKRHQEMKVILVTGITDNRVRRQVAEAGADAFFYKPVEMADFLDAVERCLGVVQTIFPAAPIDEPIKPGKPAEPARNLPDRLADLRQSLEATVVALLDERGQVIAQAGDTLDVDSETSLVPGVMATLSSSAKLAHSLGMSSPEGLICLRGVQSGLCLAPIGEAYALIIVTRKPLEVEKIGEIGRLVIPAIRDLQVILASPLGPLYAEKAEALVLPEPPAEVAEEIIEELSPEELPAIDAIFQNAPATLQTRDLDSFWNSAAEQNDLNGVVNADTITFEQARKLGLAPGEEKGKGKK